MVRWKRRVPKLSDPDPGPYPKSSVAGVRMLFSGYGPDVHDLSR
jgi:hypothetical protein